MLLLMGLKINKNFKRTVVITLSTNGKRSHRLKAIIVIGRWYYETEAEYVIKSIDLLKRTILTQAIDLIQARRFYPINIGFNIKLIPNSVTLPETKPVLRAEKSYPSQDQAHTICVHNQQV